MKQIGVRAQWVHPYTRTTINPDFSSSLKNILSQQFNPEKPDAAWCSDITYIPTNEGFVYLTSIMDLYSRKIVSWTLSTTLEAVHVADTVRKAMMLRKVRSPLVLHSDRGSQYVSDAYLEAAQKAQLSYSKKGYPYDNACIESFHSLIKREWLNRIRITNNIHSTQYDSINYVQNAEISQKNKFSSGGRDKTDSKMVVSERSYCKMKQCTKESCKSALKCTK